MLAAEIARADIEAVYSYGGRTRAPADQPLPTRTGGFGGPSGLADYIRREGITHVIFGQSARTRLEVLLKGSTLNRFLAEVKDAAIQVVPLDDSP